MTQLGWICPICGSVYSPWVASCPYHIKDRSATGNPSLEPDTTWVYDPTYRTPVPHLPDVVATTVLPEAKFPSGRRVDGYAIGDGKMVYHAPWPSPVKAALHGERLDSVTVDESANIYFDPYFKKPIGAGFNVAHLEEKPKFFPSNAMMRECTTCGFLVLTALDDLKCPVCGCTYFVQEAS